MAGGGRLRAGVQVVAGACGGVHIEINLTQRDRQTSNNTVISKRSQSKNPKAK